LQLLQLNLSSNKLDGFLSPKELFAGPPLSLGITTTEYIIANAPSPSVCFEPAVIVYHRRFQMDPAVMLTYHRRFVIRPGGDALDSVGCSGVASGTTSINGSSAACFFFVS